MKNCSSSSGSRKDMLIFYDGKNPVKNYSTNWWAQRQTIHNLRRNNGQRFSTEGSMQTDRLFSFPRLQRNFLRRYEKCEKRVKLIDKFWWMRANKSTCCKVCKWKELKIAEIETSLFIARRFAKLCFHSWINFWAFSLFLCLAASACKDMWMHAQAMWW